MFYIANDSKFVLAAPEGFAQIDLCVCFSVDVNQTKHNERKYLFPFFSVCSICILAGTNKTLPDSSSLNFNAAL